MIDSMVYTILFDNKGFQRKKTKVELYCVIKGRGAFRRFKDALHRLNLTAEWYAYREAAVRQVAIDWCELNEIDWQD